MHRRADEDEVTEHQPRALLTGDADEPTPTAYGVRISCPCGLPIVVVVDIAMPKRDGFWFVAQLQSLPGGDAVPAIAITGAPLDLLPQSVKDVGSTRALLKPVDLSSRK